MPNANLPLRCHTTKTASLKMCMLMPWCVTLVIQGHCMTIGFVAVVTRPLPRDGNMAEDHGATEAKQLPGPGPEVLE